MMTKLLWAIPVALFIGCTSFSTNVWRSEQAAVNLAYGTYQGYTNALGKGVLHVDAGQSNAIREARIKFAASIAVTEGLRQAYETNAVSKSTVQAALDAAMQNSSNIVYLIHLFQP